MLNKREHIRVAKGKSKTIICSIFEKVGTFAVAFLIITGSSCLIFYTDGYFVSEVVKTRGNQSKGTVENITNAQSPDKEAIYFSATINYPPTASLIVAIAISFLISLVVAISERARCVALLSLPGMVFYLGRLILFILIIQSLYAGPITNSWNNAKLILGMIPCQVEMFSREMMAMQSASGGAYNKEFEDAVKRMTAINIETVKKIIDVPKQTLKMLLSALKHVILDISGVNASITVNNVTLSIHDVEDYENDVNTIRHIEHPSVKGTDSLFIIGAKVNALFVDTTNSIQQLLSYMLWIVAFAIAIRVVLSARNFLYRYLRYCDNNIFFTFEEFKRLDEENKSKLLPLRGQERSQLIDSKSWWQRCPSCSELLVILWEVFHLFIPTFLAMVVLFCVFDGLLYHTMQVLQREASVSVVIGGGSGFQVAFNNTSPRIRQVYHLFPSNSTSFNYSFEVNTEGCLPSPLPPFYQDLTKLAGCLIGMCGGIVFLTFLNPYAYGRKIQHKIAAMFYPKREKERILLLYRYLLIQREICDEYDVTVSLCEGDMANNQETEGKGKSNACICTTLKRLGILGVAFLIIMGVVCLIFYTDGYFVSEEVKTGGNQSEGTVENITNAQSPDKEAIYFSATINYPPTASMIVAIVTSFLISLAVAISGRVIQNQ
ncbi:unnamed protein product [Owenia fusiformis]|uniref:Dendritic cell-specific transmembrane protein-like domain-containing protein n=1 Tax=Owenia fusiformis TaxID=6347 RepID=A0A8S4PHC1_OWEFU|nr:unnamed protein product [Owenia fusiformis]